MIYVGVPSSHCPLKHHCPQEQMEAQKEGNCPRSLSGKMAQPGLEPAPQGSLRSPGMNSRCQAGRRGPPCSSLPLVRQLASAAPQTIPKRSRLKQRAFVISRDSVGWVGGSSCSDGLCWDWTVPDGGLTHLSGFPLSRTAGMTWMPGASPHVVSHPPGGQLGLTHVVGPAGSPEEGRLAVCTRALQASACVC